MQEYIWKLVQIHSDTFYYDDSQRNYFGDDEMSTRKLDL